jgi:hypothetical protein
MIRNTLFAVLLTAVLTACGGRLAEAPARAVDFSGHWVINDALSDNPDKLVEQQGDRMRAHDRRRRDQRALDDYDDHMLFDPIGPTRRMSAAFLLNARKLDLRQSSGALTVSNGDSSTEYVFGQKSVVSLLNGAADREVGWKDNRLVVQTRSPDGPGVQQTYQLSPNRQQLLITTDLKGLAEGLTVKRIYDRLPEETR